MSQGFFLWHHLRATPFLPLPLDFKELCDFTGSTGIIQDELDLKVSWLAALIQPAMESPLANQGNTGTGSWIRVWPSLVSIHHG